MPSHGLSALAAVTVCVVVACWFAVSDRHSTVARATQQGELIFPEFQNQLTKVAAIEVTRADGKVVLSHRKDAWANMGVGGFPAISDRVESLMIAMAGMKYIAPKTKRGKRHHQLQVEDITATAKSARLTFRDDARAVLADIIIGKPKNAVNQQSVYVRLPGDAQAWLAEGRFDVHHDAAEWSDRAVVNFDARSLNALTVSKKDGDTVALYRNQPQDRKMKLKNLPAGAAVAHQHQIEYMSGLLQELNFIDARRADDTTPKAAPIFEITARWKNHLEVTLRTDEPAPDGSVWAQIDARITDDLHASDLEKQKAAKIQSKFNGWDIKLPRKFTDRIKVRLHDIIRSG